MRTVIWKYPLELTLYQSIKLPIGSQFLHCAMQHDAITLWAAVDPEARLCEREIMIQGTGQEHNPVIHDAVHLGTVFDPPMVWHVFEIEGG
jgi:hypothetical protein